MRLPPKQKWPHEDGMLVGDLEAHMLEMDGYTQKHVPVIFC